MITDDIYCVRETEYSKWFIEYLNIKLEQEWLTNKTYDLIKIFQLIELDSLELYLWNKYWIEFIQRLSKLF